MSIGLEITLLAAVVTSFILKILPDQTVKSLLFDGEIQDSHKTKFALKEVVDRYRVSVTTLNRSLAINIGFAFFALYAYFVLPENEFITVPYINLSISRALWAQIAPAIAVVLQIYTFTAFVWFMALRLGQRMLLRECSDSDDFGDVRNIVLTGPIAHLWILARIRSHFKSKLHIIWFAPVLAILSLIVAGPIFVFMFFLVKLYANASYAIAIPYSILLLPYAGLVILLLATALILGVGESYVHQSIRDSGVSKISIGSLARLLGSIKEQDIEIKEPDPRPHNITVEDPWKDKEPWKNKET